MVPRHLRDWLGKKNFHLRWILQTEFIFQKVTRVFQWKFPSPHSTTALFTRFRTFRLFTFRSYKDCIARA
jgi:hypothetical protein